MSCWTPIMPIALQDLGYSIPGIANIFGALSIAAILAPWIGGQLADRVLPAQYIVMISNLLGGVLLYACASERRYGWVLGYLLAQAVLYMPTFAITNHIVMSHLQGGPRNFGYVRMFGTAGWVVGSVSIGLWLSHPVWLPIASSASLADGLRGAALLSFVAAALSLILPHTPPARREQGRAQGTSPSAEAETIGTEKPFDRFAVLGALRLLRDRRIAVLMIVSFVFSLASPFVFPIGGLYLRALGVPDSEIPVLLALGQAVEVFVFGITALSIRHIGYRWTFVIGMSAWVLRFLIWSIGAPFWLVAASLGLHGFCYAWMYGLGQMFVDHCADRATRASAQALHLVVTVGLGIWPANWIAAGVTAFFTTQGADGAPHVNYSQMFLWPAAATLAAVVAFAVYFRDEQRPVGGESPARI
jgi:hypothetical protein